MAFFQAKMCAVNPDTLFCKALNADQVTLYRTVEGHGCGQVAISSTYEKYAEDFAGFAVGDCADQGFKHSDGSKTLAIPIIGNVTMQLFDNVLKGEEVTLFQITGSECGQSTLPKKYESYAQKFDKELKEGTCAAQGYTVADGAKDINVPFIGTIHTAEFKKPALAAANDVVSLYQVEFGICAEVDVANQLEASILEKADKALTVGTCASAGYTKADGSKDINIPVVGDIKFSLYTKAKETLQMMI